MTIFLILLPAIGFSQIVKTNLYRKPVEPVQQETEQKSSPAKSAPKPHAALEAGNLPGEYQRRSAFRITENPVILPQSPQKVVFPGLPFGEVLEAQISESVIAFPDAKAPVRAIVSRGKLKGAILLGEATLEKNSKRIAIEFKKLRGPQKIEAFGVQAVALDAQGILGLKGKYQSGEAKYFSAELIAALAAGYADASVERNVTPFGQTQEPNTAANAGRKAVAGALSRTADRFAEKVRAATEYSVLEGPVAIRILIQDQPKAIE